MPETGIPDTRNTVSTEAENLKGTAKEMAGKAIGDEGLEQEGEQQQKKAQATEEAQDLEDAAAEKRQQAAGHAGAEKAAD